MKKINWYAVLFVLSVAGSLFAYFQTSDKSIKKDVTVVGTANPDSLSLEDRAHFANAFDDEIILKTVTEDGTRLYAVYPVSRLENREYPFEARARIYPDGFAFIY